MGQISVKPKKCRGRPQVRPDEETLQLLVEAAAVEFQENDYASATMGNVAQRAGISTKTMYRLIPCKADLFKKVISDRIGQFMREADLGELDKYELEEALEHLLISFGSLTLSKETISLLRLVIAERDRFPELAASFHGIAVTQTTAAIVQWLDHQKQLGRLKFDDPEATASALRGMMTLDLQRSAMLGVAGIPTPEEIKDRAKLCARIFLGGCRP